jgi:hypothetical protein
MLKRTKRTTIFACTLLIVASQLSHGQAVEVKVRNDTNFEMQELYVFADPAAERGRNLLSGGPLFSGSEVTVSVDASARYLLAVDSEGDSYLVEGIDPRQTRVLAIALDDLYFGDDMGTRVAAGVWDLSIVNDTNYRLTGLWYRPAGTAQWSELSARLPIDAGGLLEASIPMPEDADTVELRAVDEDGDEYVKTGLRAGETRSARFTFDDLQW